jgi:uncharacterized protein YcbX
VKVSGLFVYPIKACAGISLETAEVVERGLACDRRYMLVDRAGTFVSQRERFELHRVATQLTGSDVILRAPGMAELLLPQTPAGGEHIPFRIWGSAGSALVQPAGSAWFSRLLGDEVSLVYMPDDERRAVNPSRARPDDIVAFQDGYPLLVISEASLADLNARLPAPVEMRRFRPNLVLSGCEPYAEDHFSSLSIGPIAFRAVKRCDRCVVTTIDPVTGEKGKEPLRTLAKYRLEDGKVWFGMNLIHDGPGTLRVGDTVTLR